MQHQRVKLLFWNLCKGTKYYLSQSIIFHTNCPEGSLDVYSQKSGLLGIYRHVYLLKMKAVCLNKLFQETIFLQSSTVTHKKKIKMYSLLYNRLVSQVQFTKNKAGDQYSNRNIFPLEHAKCVYYYASNVTKIVGPIWREKINSICTSTSPSFLII